MMIVTIINAGGNNDYIYGLITGLSKLPDLTVDIIDSDKSVQHFSKFSNVKLLPFIENYGYNISFIRKVKRLVLYHIRLLTYAWQTKNKVFHIQWGNKFKFFDRIFLPIYYKLLGKKIIFTVHNVDAQARDDGRSSRYNRITLRFMYHRMDRLIAHTESIKRELMKQFNIPAFKINVIMHGINVKAASSSVSKYEERIKLNIPSDAKVMLCFGALLRYKGLDMIIEAMPAILAAIPEARLLIAGHSIKNKQYAEELLNLVSKLGLRDKVILHSKWIPDEEVGTYFNAADCVVLPYRSIFQSGVPFMAYRFGIPVIATRVGGLPEVVLENETGFVCEPDVDSLTRVLLHYFKSSLYNKLNESRSSIKIIAHNLYSWEKIAKETYNLYQEVEKNTYTASGPK